jgi:hypothetical protein
VHPDRVPFAVDALLGGRDLAHETAATELGSQLNHDDGPLGRAGVLRRLTALLFPLDRWDAVEAGVQPGGVVLQRRIALRASARVAKTRR